MASAKTMPVTSEVSATARIKGKPSPSDWLAGCGYSSWLYSVSGIENVVPSITSVRNPCHRHSSGTAASHREATPSARRRTTPAVTLARARQ